jgi:hypothetical protein
MALPASKEIRKNYPEVWQLEQFPVFGGLSGCT